MDVLARAGAEIVGLDLSPAVDVARQNLRSLPNCHFIQADALYPPVSSWHVRFRLRHWRAA
jgi:methylase of polypeptide subunit release factors